MTTIEISGAACDEFDRKPNESVFLFIFHFKFTHPASKKKKKKIRIEFVSPDLEKLTVRVKHMNIIDLNSAIVCRLEAGFFFFFSEGVVLAIFLVLFLFLFLFFKFFFFF